MVLLLLLFVRNMRKESGVVSLIGVMVQQEEEEEEDGDSERERRTWLHSQIRPSEGVKWRMRLEKIASGRAHARVFNGSLRERGLGGEVQVVTA